MQIEYKIIDGLSDYLETLNLMEQKVQEIANGHSSSEIWLLEHDHVYTSGTGENTNIPDEIQGVKVIKVGRGGKITYHGPGQLVIYPILNLKELYGSKVDIRDYVTRLESIIIKVLKNYALTGFAVKERVGIWVNKDASGNNIPESKIAAIGIRISKSVSFHGVSLNINPNLQYFNEIIPCGLKGFGVTSLEQLTENYDLRDINQLIINAFSKEFG